MKSTCVLVIVSFSLCAPLCHSQAVQSSGSRTPPGCASAVDYRVVAQKQVLPADDPDYPGSEVNAWIEFKNPNSDNPCSFVLCFMLDLNTSMKMEPVFKAGKDPANNNWKCTNTGNAKAKPNFHYGCQQVTVPAHAGRGKPGDPALVSLFPDPNTATKKKHATMSQKFKTETLSVYMDMLKDCPVDASCKLCKADQVLVPESPQDHAD